MRSTDLTITFLGTGTSTGIPMIACPCAVCTSTDKKNKRLRTSILIQSPSTTIVVDTTPDFRYQMLRINNKKLDAVLFTHPHKDHIAGLDDVRAYNFFENKPMDVYANSLTAEALKREFAYVFADKKYPGVPQINLYTIDETPFVIGDISIKPFIVWHHKMPVYGFQFKDFTYITDANKIDEPVKNIIKDSKIIVLNALRNEQHVAHFTLKEAISLVQELKIPEAYFTHISHQLGLHNEVERNLPQGIHLAYDGLTLNI